MRRQSTTLTCPSGHTFHAEVYRSVNVTRAPNLRDDALAGRLNQVCCPTCHAEFHAHVPFLYHDMDTAVRVWVYPERDRDHEEAILVRIRRAAAIMNSVLPTDRSGPELVFGLAGLKPLIEPPAAE